MSFVLFMDFVFWSLFLDVNLTYLLRSFYTFIYLSKVCQMLNWQCFNKEGFVAHYESVSAAAELHRPRFESWLGSVAQVMLGAWLQGSRQQMGDNNSLTSWRCCEG